MLLAEVEGSVDEAGELGCELCAAPAEVPAADADAAVPVSELLDGVAEEALESSHFSEIILASVTLKEPLSWLGVPVTSMV